MNAIDFLENFDNTGFGRFNTTQLQRVGREPSHENMNNCTDMGDYYICVGKWKDFSPQSASALDFSEEQFNYTAQTNNLDIPFMLFDFKDTWRINNLSTIEGNRTCFSLSSCFIGDVFAKKRNGDCVFGAGTGLNTHTGIGYLCSSNNASYDYIETNKANFTNGGNAGYPNYSMVYSNLTFQSKNYTNPFNQIFIIASGSGGDGYKLDYIKFNNLVNGTSLPIVNITIVGNESEFCLNENGTVTVPLNITGYSAAGDLIYYSTKINSLLNKTKRVSFTANNLCLYGLCTKGPDFSSFVNMSLGCPINRHENLMDWWKQIAYSIVMNNLIPYYNPLIQDTEYMLELNGNCLAEGYYYPMPNTLANYLRVDLFIDNDEILNVTYKDYSLADLFTVSLDHNATDGKVFVFVNNTLIGNVTAETTKFVTLRIVPQDTSYYIEFGSNKSTLKRAVLDRNPYNDLTSYLVMTNTGKVVIRDFTYSNSQLVPTFTATPPDSVEFTTTGQQQIILYVSDDVHQDPLEYDHVILPIMIYDSDHCGYISGRGVGRADQAIERVDVLGAIKGIFGKSLKSYLQTLGYYEIGQKLLWFIFVIVLLLLLISTFNPGLALVVSALAIGFLALMVDYTVILISMLMLLGLGLALLFIPGGGK